MKSFLEYLFESQLNEGHFKNEDFAKDDYKYLRPVVSDIVHKGKLSLGDKSVEHEIDIDDSIRQQFARYEDDVSKLSKDEFDKMLSANTQHAAWTKIFKGTYSGFAKGSTDGQYAEAAVAYVFNVMNGKKDIMQEADDDVSEITNILQSKDIKQDWIASSKISAEKIYKSVPDPKRYTAAHVDGNDISQIPQNVKQIAMIFHGKPGIKSVLGSKISASAVNSLYSSQKDTWNKADIVLVDSQLDINAMLQDKPQFVISDEFNEFLNNLIIGGYIIPISLKMVSPNAKLDQITFKQEGFGVKEQKDQHEIDSLDNATVNVILPTKPLATDQYHKYAASCYLKTSTGLEVDFRAAKADKPRLSIEIKLKTARGGKAMTELKNQLQLAPNFYADTQFESTKHFLDELKALTGQQPQVSDAMVQSDPSWFNRPAFKGLIALLKIYREKIEHKTSGKVDVLGFFKLLYNCASGANSKSIFYLLTMK